MGSPLISGISSSNALHDQSPVCLDNLPAFEYNDLDPVTLRPDPQQIDDDTSRLEQRAAPTVNLQHSDPSEDSSSLVKLKMNGHPYVYIFKSDIVEIERKYGKMDNIRIKSYLFRSTPVEVRIPVILRTYKAGIHAYPSSAHTGLGRF